MSAWEPYLDSIKNNCQNSNLQAIGIIGENGAVWADRNSGMTPAEAAILYKAAENDDKALFGTGFTVGGQKFACTKVDGDEGTIFGKGKEGNKFGTGFIAVNRIKGAILFAIGDKDASAGNVSCGVYNIASYLRNNGYEI